MLRWLIWSGFVLLWTVALEVPVNVTTDAPAGEFILTNRIVIAKTLHVAAYAMMAILSGWVRAPMRYRWLMMFFLMAHATVTELLQAGLKEHFHRTGDLYDVGIDHAGILLGAIVSWKWWTNDPPLSPPRERGGEH